MSSAIDILLLITVLVYPVWDIVHAASPHGTRGDVHVDTSKVLYFNPINEGGITSSSRGRLHDKDTIDDVVAGRDEAFMKTPSMTAQGEGRSSDDTVNDVHSRKRRSTDFSSVDAVAIVAKHNEGRRNVNPEAADMKMMEWDDDLATMAQQWTDGCLYEHGNPDNISPFGSVGQNLYIKWGLSSPGTPPDGTAATQAWYNEYQYYSYDDISCQSGKVCGHYTQNVWASTYAVGCGIKFCESATDNAGKAYDGAWMITCNYGPAGNYRGSKPYTAGSPCTKCTSGKGLCSDKLCTDCSPSDSNCECRAECDNCGSLNSDCTCTCPGGWYGSDCATPCEDTHANCGANPGWPVSWCDRSYVINGCPLFCSLCNAANPDFVCNSNLQTQNSVQILIYENITQWHSIQSAVMSSFRNTIITYCSARQYECCPAANNTVVDFSNVGLALGENYPKQALLEAQPAYRIQVVGLSPVAPGQCAAGDGGFLSAAVVVKAIEQDTEALETSLGINIGETKESGAGRVLTSIQTLLLAIAAVLLNM